jgi:predicted DNA-binding protein YlxM (UPF0122 family)
MNTFIYTLSDESGNIRYIGKTNTPRKRLYSHIKECYSNKKSHKISWIKSLLNKGERPIIEIIDIVPENEWKFWEVYWIEQFKQWGFKLTNQTEGGQGGNGYKHSEESKLKMSISKKGIKLSEEHKQNISEKVKSKFQESPAYNRSGNNIKKPIDRELLYQLYIVENLSMPKIAKKLNCGKRKVFDNLKEYDIHKDKSEWIKQVASNPKKAVIQYDLEGNLLREWEGVVDIKKDLNLDVSGCCLGNKKTCGGFIWRYKDNWFELNLDSLDNNPKKVSQYDLSGNLLNSFNSMFEASKYTSINQGNIGECCRRNYKSAGGFIWRFFEDNPPKKYTNKTTRPVQQFDLEGNLIGKFDSIVEAAKKTGSRNNCIQMCCVGKYKSSNGYIWKYENNI